jgi:hypothetical protein
VDKQGAQFTSLHPAKDDPFVFALLVDASGSETIDGQAIRSVAAASFRRLSTGTNRGYRRCWGRWRRNGS